MLILRRSVSLSRSTVALAVGLLGLLGCEPASIGWDASVIYGDVVIAHDVVQTGAPDYRHCTQDRDCPSAHCLVSYPGGICTNPCHSDPECGWNGLCANGFCLPRCVQHETICSDYGATCALIAPDRRVCIPTCNVTSSMCASPLVCDSQRGTCGPLRTSGANVGSSCAVDDDCHGLCLASTVGLSICVGVTRRPADSAFVSGSALPNTGCPPGTVILPLPGEVEGDYTYCWASCTRDAECITGYRCDLQGTASAPFANGGCRL